MAKKKGAGSKDVRAASRALSRVFECKVRVDEEGNAILQGRPSRAERRRPVALADVGRGADASDRRYPKQVPGPSEAPKAWVPPPDDWRAEAEAMREYTELFVDGGRELEEAMFEVMREDSSTRFVVIPWERYTEYAQRVLGAGYVFEIRADGGRASKRWGWRNTRSTPRSCSAGQNASTGRTKSCWKPSSTGWSTTARTRPSCA